MPAFISNGYPNTHLLISRYSVVKKVFAINMEDPVYKPFSSMFYFLFFEQKSLQKSSYFLNNMLRYISLRTDEFPRYNAKAAALKAA